MMEGHLLLATLAQRVTFSLVSEQTIDIGQHHRLILRPSGAVNMRVQKIQSRERAEKILSGVALSEGSRDMKLEKIK